MTLKVDIKYKSNAQQGALKGQLIRVLYIRACNLNFWDSQAKEQVDLRLEGRFG